MFDLDALEAELAQTVFAGRLHFVPVTDSTNNDALTAARSGAPHGSVWFADEQLAGRGRGGNAWRSAAGEGLYVSTLLRLGIPTDRLLLLPLAAGLAAVEAVRDASDLHIDLRWPNDLLIGDKKTGGILVEAGSENGVAFAVVGIGINVHQRGFDPGLATPATSLDLAAGRAVSRQTLLVKLLNALAREADGPQACAGITAGLDEHGFLLVDTPGGRVTVQTGGIRTGIPGGIH
jgi:BirA family biotin operon repressor/biotin-[acetyl-CoA-carboxylase] ligase